MVVIESVPFASSCTVSAMRVMRNVRGITGLGSCASARGLSVFCGRAQRATTIEPARTAFVKRAEPLNPELWLTPDAILDGVRSADGLFEQLRAELLHSSRE